MSSAFLYTRASDNLLLTATIAVNTGTEDPDYLATNLIDGHPEKPGKLTTTSGSWVTTLATASRVDAAFIFHPNIDAGLEVRLQANSSNSWGGTLPIDTLFTILPRYANQFPVNPWLDVEALVPVAANRTLKYWRWNFAGVNSAPVSIGELWLSGAKRTLGTRGIRPGLNWGLHQPAIVHNTELMVRHKYPFGTTMRTLQVDVVPTDTTRDEIDTWQRDAEYLNVPFAFLPTGLEADAWLGEFTNTDLVHQRILKNWNPSTLALQESSRGLFP